MSGRAVYAVATFHAEHVAVTDSHLVRIESRPLEKYWRSDSGSIGYSYYVFEITSAP